MKTLLVSSCIALIASPLLAASTEKAQAYLDRVIEVTDFDETAVITAEQVMASWTQMGMTFSGENAELAQTQLKDAFLKMLPEATKKTLPVIEEVYTDEELDALLAFMETPEGASAIGKGGIAGGKSATIMQEDLMGLMSELMPIMQLADQPQ